jgi:hypothetical protein
VSKPCCGKGATAKRALVRTNGPITFSGDKPPLHGRCSVCGSKGGFSKKFHGGLRVRVFICQDNGHFLKP